MVGRSESEERRIGTGIEPAKKRRVSSVWEHFDLVTPTKVHLTSFQTYQSCISGPVFFTVPYFIFISFIVSFQTCQNNCIKHGVNTNMYLRINTYINQYTYTCAYPYSLNI